MIGSTGRALLPLTLASLAWVSPGARAAGLVELYESALGHDAGVRAARARFEAERFGIGAARGELRPQLNLSGGASLEYADSDGGGGVGGAVVDSGATPIGGTPGGVDGSDDWTEQSISLDLSQALFDPRNRRRVDRAEIDALAAEASLVDASQALLLEVATLYFDVLRARAAVTTTNAELDAVRRQVRTAQQRFDVGAATRTDVLDASAELDLLQAELVRDENDLLDARERLRQVAGTDGAPLDRLADDMPERPPVPADPETWVELALERNPGLAVTRLEARSADAGIGVQRAERLPVIDLVGAAALARTDRDGTPDTDTASIGVQLTLPLLSGGRVTALIGQARSLSEAAGEDLLDETRAVSRDVRIAYADTLASLREVEALRQALRSTRASFESVRNEFDAGSRTSLDVLEAASDTFSAEFDLADARFRMIVDGLILRASAGTLSVEDLRGVDGFLVPTSAE